MLDRVRVADVRPVRIASRIAKRTALAKEIPTSVEFDLYSTQSLVICLQEVGITAV